MSERIEAQTFYELLEVPTTAGPFEIYTAYQRAKSAYSPNSAAIYSMFTEEEAKELMDLIEEAYQTLSHQARRKEYDSKIGLAPVAAPNSSKPAPPPPKPATDNWVGQVKVQARREELPKGFARTKFSVYEVKLDMESEFGALTEMDGLWLQRIRLYKGVTLDQMAEETRIGKSVLVALEANDLGALPVAVFTRGFVVQICRVLSLNERQVADAYMRYFRANKS